jgi:uncharacterized protein YlxP (DUF503 family)
MFVAAGFITLDTSECKTLKEKRSIARSIIDKTKAKYNSTAIGEVGYADNLKLLKIGVSVVANEQTIVETMLTKTIVFIEENSFRTIVETNAQIYSL